MNEEDLALLAKIQHTTLDVLAGAIGPGFSRAVLIDYPRHKNAGDALIYAGERQYLERLGLERPYTIDIGRYSRDRVDGVLEGSVVLFHGGGNLGDVWPEYQEFREYLIPTLRKNKVVVLAQSTWFTDLSAAARANRVFAEHGDVTLLLRDHQSFDRAHEYFPDVKTIHCPDMAFGNGPLARSRAADQPYVFLSREDHEKAVDIDPRALEGLDRYAVDWESGMTARNRAAWYVHKAPGIIYRRIAAARPLLENSLFASQERMCDLNVSSAVGILSHGEVIVTDRLHAHVFALLLGIPHVVLDNSYGKISAIFDDYSGRFTTAHLAGSKHEALNIVAALAQSGSGG